MDGMFYRAVAADPYVNHWDVSSVRNTNDMFAFATKANPVVDHWRPWSLESSVRMFAYATSAKPNVASWHRYISSLEYSMGMFAGTSSFDANEIESWEITPSAKADLFKWSPL